jgi:hypothetical protein
MVIDRSAPVLVHVWFGPLYRDGDQSLIGWIDLDAAVRPPRNDGSRDVEIVLETGTMEPGPELAVHVGACAARIRDALDRLSGLKRYAVDHAPAGWARYYAAQPGLPLPGRLFLEGIEVSEQLLVSLVFDFGDLDLLTLSLDHDGAAARVFLAP